MRPWLLEVITGYENLVLARSGVGIRRAALAGSEGIGSFSGQSSTICQFL